jgi:hypothetical protein
MKLRPVLLLTGTIGPSSEVLAPYISSVVPSRLLVSDIVLDPNVPEYHQMALKTLIVTDSVCAERSLALPAGGRSRPRKPWPGTGYRVLRRCR